MAYDLENKLVVGVSSRALFDLTYENTIYESDGVEAYCRYQIEHEDELLRPGPGFPLHAPSVYMSTCFICLLPYLSSMIARKSFYHISARMSTAPGMLKMYIF